MTAFLKILVLFVLVVGSSLKETEYAPGRKNGNILKEMKDVVWGSNSTPSHGEYILGESTDDSYSYIPFDTRILTYGFTVKFKINGSDSKGNFLFKVGTQTASYGYSEAWVIKSAVDGKDYIQLWKTNSPGGKYDGHGYTAELTNMALILGKTYTIRFERTDEINYGGAFITLSDGSAEFRLYIAKNKSAPGSIIISTPGGNELFALLHGYPFVSLTKGNVRISDFSMSSSKLSRKNRVTIWGDSFMEGSTMVNHGLDNRWCSRYGSAVGMEKVMVSGRGGQSISKAAINSYLKEENNLFVSRYTVIALSINNYGKGYNEWLSALQEMIAILKANKQIPLLVTITPYNNPNAMDFVNSANNWIRNSGYRYADFFDEVYDANTKTLWKDGYGLNDGVHPSVLGHERMFERLKIDLPELFDL